MSKKFSSYKNHQLITESWRKFLNEGTPDDETITEVRFRPQNPKELGTQIDALIEKLYSGEFEGDIFNELKIYLAAGAESFNMEVNDLIDHLINKKFSFELKTFLMAPGTREKLIN